MNILAFTSLQASGGGATGASGTSFLIMMVLLFVVMWAFMIRPQRKQQKELEKFRNELKRGDKVVTAGGIYGVVDEIKDRSVLIKVDGDVKLRVDKNSIVRDFTEDAPKA
ncbi:MAG: preprotein translocase subunit YajC [Bacteroidales bacterium]|nr:preprotein translocase subunit YajC [Bacteroidales bacterium]